MKKRFQGFDCKLYNRIAKLFSVIKNISNSLQWRLIPMFKINLQLAQRDLAAVK